MKTMRSILHFVIITQVPRYLIMNKNIIIIIIIIIIFIASKKTKKLMRNKQMNKKKKKQIYTLTWQYLNYKYDYKILS